MGYEENVAFDFGRNWRGFSNDALNVHKLESALKSLQQLIGQEKFKGSTFLDIGCGSGIFAIAASLAGAKKVIGIDISKESIATSIDNKKRFAEQNDIEFFHKSILDEDTSQLGKFDIVYSWGVLHHTGNMYKAIDKASNLAAVNSLFVIAIYNKHWSCKAWKAIKWFYNIMPGFIQKLMIWIFFIVIAAAKLIVTRRNPFKKKKRGMSFYYDVVDWVGGYPYEYATKDAVIAYMEKKGFRCLKTVHPSVPTGCNEFVFLRDGVKHDERNS